MSNGQIFPFRLIIERCLGDKTPLFLSFIDDEQAFNSVDRRAKVLSLYGIPDKYNKVIRAVYDNLVRKTSFFYFKIRSNIKT